MTTTEHRHLPLSVGTGLVPGVGDDRTLTRKDFSSDQEVRWCPGCGDYAILAAFQGFLPELGIAPENVVVISGIGCSSRFTYYMDTYGMHSIHGRAPVVATGIATSRPDLSVWVMTGDGDAMSIGGNHLIHAMRRNVNLNIVMFNNEIYGLTKGQYSPTSPTGTVTKTSPTGSIDHPFDPMRLALGTDCTFVARTTASARQHLTEVFRQAAQHRGTSFIEVLQECVIFNDGAFDAVKDTKGEHVLRLEAGQPLISGGRCLVMDPQHGVQVVPTDSVDPSAILVHEPGRESAAGAFALASLDDTHRDLLPIGIFRQVSRGAYDDGVREQIRLASEAAGGEVTDTDISALFAGRNSWQVEARA